MLMLKSLKKLRLFILGVSLQPDIDNVLGCYLHCRVHHLYSSQFELNPAVSPQRSFNSLVTSQLFFLISMFSFVTSISFLWKIILLWSYCKMFPLYSFPSFNITFLSLFFTSFVSFFILYVLYKVTILSELMFANVTWKCNNRPTQPSPTLTSLHFCLIITCNVH